MFAGINIFWIRTSLTLAQAKRTKMSSEKGLKYIYAQEYKLYYYYCY